MAAFVRGPVCSHSSALSTASSAGTDDPTGLAREVADLTSHGVAMGGSGRTSNNVFRLLE